jgi:hypothetical protein
MCRWYADGGSVGFEVPTNSVAFRKLGGRGAFMLSVALGGWAVGTLRVVSVPTYLACYCARLVVLAYLHMTSRDPIVGHYDATSMPQVW